MIVEYSFISQANNKCHLALCSESKESIQEVASEYWRKHGIQDGSWGAFEFHRNPNNEYIGLVACTKITPAALEYGLNSFEQWLGQRCQMTDLLNIIRDFDKKFSI